MSSLTNSDCDKIITKLLNSDNYCLNSFEIVPFRFPLQGLIGEHSTLQIQYTVNREQKTEEFFVKTLSPNPVLSEISKAIQVYEKEKFYYELLDEFEKYKIDVSFAPKGFYFTNGTTILQDISLLGFKGTPKGQFLDEAHCKQCLEAMAKFHAATIIYENKKSLENGTKYNLFEQYPEELKDRLAPGPSNPVATRWLQSAIQGLFSLIDLLPNNSKISNDQFKEKLGEVLAVDEEPQGLINTILHNDLWTCNILYKYNEKSEPTTAKLLDFQTISYGPVELDVMKFFMVSVQKSVRKQSQKDLIGYYYEKLLGLIGNVIDLPNKSEFIDSCENFALVGSIRAIVDHSFTFMSDDVFAEAIKTEEGFRNFLYEGRGQFIIDSFKNNETFRKTLVEDAIELREMLFGKN